MDQTLGVKIPSLVFNGILMVHSIILWGTGAFYLILGVLLYHILGNLYIGKEGLENSTAFLYMCITFGIILIAASFITNFIVIHPSLHRFCFLCVIYLVVIAFITIHYAIGKYSTPFLREAMKKGFVHVMKNFNAEHVINNHLNALQQNMECCGSYNFTSWFDTAWAGGVARVPPSCCKNLAQCHNLQPLIVNDIFTKGCFRPIDAVTLVLQVALLSIFLGTIVTQIAATLCGVIMAIRHKKMHEITSVIPLF
ncbi:hypothetical protein JTE90_025740 [Oedothorax gibbosus]|uniref:Tetraspanin n=1 Tax=Oedothorax gibbosus TaxID=931172 RepID=A0AAV6UU65_9ARAC|nr:hypothetical protein JTE90_025740 [Oedothorax gibbosus]